MKDVHAVLDAILRLQEERKALTCFSPEWWEISAKVEALMWVAHDHFTDVWLQTERRISNGG